MAWLMPRATEDVARLCGLGPARHDLKWLFPYGGGTSVAGRHQSAPEDTRPVLYAIAMSQMDQLVDLRQTNQIAHLWRRVLRPAKWKLQLAELQATAWAIILLIVGTLSALRRLDCRSLQWSAVFRLWPYRTNVRWRYLGNPSG